MPTTTWRSASPLDLAASVARYARWGDDPVNTVAGGWYWRVVDRPGDPTPYRARQRDDGAVTVETPHRDAIADVLADLRHRLADDLPVAPLQRLAATDPAIGALWQRFPGLRPPFTRDPFESIVTSITAQQVNLRWATTTRARLVQRFGHEVEWKGRRLRAFPTAAALAGADPTELRTMQFTTAKAGYIVGVARAAAEGYLAGIGDMEDAALVAHATALRGVGRWTAEWLLARCLGRPAVLAAGDLGVRKAVGVMYLGRAEPASETETREVAARWGDAANWAAHLLLEQLAAPPEA